jgi:hypothetical protein
MSFEMGIATYKGDVQAIVRLVAGGEDVNCVDDDGRTPVVRVLACGHGLDVVMALINIGADLSIVDNYGTNVVYAAAVGGNVDCIDYILATTTFDINSTTTNGTTPLMGSLFNNRCIAATHFVGMGANLFAKIDDGKGRRTIEIPVHNHPSIFLGPRVLNHFKELKWQSVEHLLLLYTDYDSPILLNEGHAQVQSAHLASRVLASPDLIRVIASYFIPSKIITRDKSIEVRDAVRERVEAQLAGLNIV